MFEQTEALWQGSCASQLEEVALPDQLHSDSMDPESSSSPDKSPHRDSQKPAGESAFCQVVAHERRCKADKASDPAQLYLQATSVCNLPCMMRLVCKAGLNVSVHVANALVDKSILGHLNACLSRSTTRRSMHVVIFICRHADTEFPKQ